MAIPRLRATASIRANFLSILQENHTFSILHTNFYKTPTSVCLFYTIFYLNNTFSSLFFISHRFHHLTKLSKISLTFSISLFSTFFFFLLSSFFFSFSFLHLQHLHLLLLILILILILLLFLFLFEFDYG